MSRRRVVLGALILVVLAVAAVATVVATGDGGDRENTHTALTGRGESGTTTITIAPPALATTGEDWNAIYRSMMDYENWLFQHPDVGLLDAYISPACDCYETTQASLNNLMAAGQRLAAPGVLRVRQVELRREFRPGNVLLYVVIEGAEGAILDRGGNVVERVEPVSPRASLDTLIRGPDGRWRIAQQTLTNSPPEEP